MNKHFAIVCAALTLVAFAPQAAAASTYSGSFLVGEPLGYLIYDACINPELEGINSNCVKLDAGNAGLEIVLTATAARGVVVDADVCFYSDVAFLNCDDVVPAGATRAAVFALGGVQVSWTLVVG